MISSVKNASIVADSAELARRILSDRAFQTELPAPEQRPTPLLIPGEWVAILLWIGLILLIVVAASWLVNELVRTRRHAAESPAVLADVAVASESVAEMRRRAGGLAEEGRFDAAIHLLLLGAIRHFGSEMTLASSPASTSRELLRRLPLSPRRRAAFGELVGRVELSLFGGHAVAADDWNACRDNFDRLVRNLAA